MNGILKLHTYQQSVFDPALRVSRSVEADADPAWNDKVRKAHKLLAEAATIISGLADSGDGMLQCAYYDQVTKEIQTVTFNVSVSLTKFHSITSAVER